MPPHPEILNPCTFLCVESHQNQLSTPDAQLERDLAHRSVELAREEILAELTVPDSYNYLHVRANLRQCTVEILEYSAVLAQELTALVGTLRYDGIDGFCVVIIAHHFRHSRDDYHALNVFVLRSRNGE